MAIEKGNSDAMYNLGLYYRKNKKHLDLLKLYQMINDNIGMINLLNDLFSSADTINNDIIKYISTFHKFIKSVKSVKLIISVKLLFNSIKTEPDLMELHVKYSMNGKGFEEAKNDFLYSILRF